MIQLGVKFFYICGPLKLEDKFSASEILRWDWHGIIVIDTHIWKGKNWKQKGIIGPKRSWNSVGQTPLVSRPGNKPLWPSLPSEAMVLSLASGGAIWSTPKSGHPPSKVTYWRVSRIRTWTSFGGHSPADYGWLTGVYICQNALKCTLKMDAFYYI